MVPLFTAHKRVLKNRTEYPFYPILRSPMEDIDMSTWQKLSEQELNMRIWGLSTVVHSSGSDPSWNGAEISLGLRFINRLGGGMCVQDYDSDTIGSGENLGEALAALRSL